MTISSKDIIILILSLAVLLLGSYVVFDKFHTTDNNQNNDKNNLYNGKWQNTCK